MFNAFSKRSMSLSTLFIAAGLMLGGCSSPDSSTTDSLPSVAEEKIPASMAVVTNGSDSYVGDCPIPEDVPALSVTDFDTKTQDADDYESHPQRNARLLRAIQASSCTVVKAMLNGQFGELVKRAHKVSSVTTVTPDDYAGWIELSSCTSGYHFDRCEKGPHATVSVYWREGKVDLALGVQTIDLYLGHDRPYSTFKAYYPSEFDVTITNADKQTYSIAAGRIHGDPRFDVDTIEGAIQFDQQAVDLLNENMAYLPKK